MHLYSVFGRVDAKTDQKYKNWGDQAVFTIPIGRAPRSGGSTDPCRIRLVRLHRRQRRQPEDDNFGGRRRHRLSKSPLRHRMGLLSRAQLWPEWMHQSTRRMVRHDPTDRLQRTRLCRQNRRHWEQTDRQASRTTSGGIDASDGETDSTPFASTSATVTGNRSGRSQPCRAPAQQSGSRRPAGPLGTSGVSRASWAVSP